MPHNRGQEIDNDLTVGDRKIIHDINVKINLFSFLYFNSKHLKIQKL